MHTSFIINKTAIVAAESLCNAQGLMFNRHGDIQLAIVEGALCAYIDTACSQYWIGAFGCSAHIYIYI